MLEFDVAIYGMNEADAIAACVRSVDENCAGRSARITVVLNGTTDDSLNRLRELRLRHAPMTVHAIPVADKANAVNQYLFRLRAPGTISVGVDAFVRVSPGSLSALAEALRDAPHARAASGIPVTGRSARAHREQILRGGALTGQLHAIRHDFLARLTSRNIRLPVGLYRGDGLLGSMIAHDLDAIGHPWDPSRVVGVPGATFAFAPLSPLRWRDIRRHYRRIIRQAKGRIETEAVKHFIYAGGYEALPGNAAEMVRAWRLAVPTAPLPGRPGYVRWQALRDLERSAALRPAEAKEVYRQELDGGRGFA